MASASSGLYPISRNTRSTAAALDRRGRGFLSLRWGTRNAIDRTWAPLNITASQGCAYAGPKVNAACGAREALQRDGIQ